MTAKIAVMTFHRLLLSGVVTTGLTSNVVISDSFQRTWCGCTVTGGACASSAPPAALLDHRRTGLALEPGPWTQPAASVL